MELWSTNGSSRRSSVTYRFDAALSIMYPRHSAPVVSAVLAVVTVLFVPLGVTVIKTSDSVTQYSVRYDTKNRYVYRVGNASDFPHKFHFKNDTFSTGARASEKIVVKKTMSSPVYIQYRLVGFYQNFRRYQASRDYAQFTGDVESVSTACEPFRHPGENTGNAQKGIYLPCGSIAWSLFNDTISLYKLHNPPKGETADENTTLHELVCNGTAFDEKGESTSENNSCRKRGIAMPSEVSFFSKFSPAEDMAIWRAGGNPSAEDPFQQEGYYYGEAGHRIPSVTDEDFIVWSSLAYTSDFKKMYRVITTDLTPGEYVIDVVENFDVTSFGGEKHVIISTRGWLGEQNYPLGISFLVVGCVSFVLSLSVFVLQFFRHADAYAVGVCRE
ncbi:putative LEM3 (ligand effect modulator 3) family CDC50 family [Trypanosoma vivax]|nr:putative LEM3 (ligand effect modulator 3) family CDC50 family [Trypanosoma vivax]